VYFRRAYSIYYRILFTNSRSRSSTAGADAKPKSMHPKKSNLVVNSLVVRRHGGLFEGF
jgi:hypothetical protein